VVVAISSTIGRSSCRAAPLGPEIDQHRRIGLQHLRLEVVIAHVHNLVSHGQTPDLSNEAAAGTAPIG
jgi:hypothetical protein